VIDTNERALELTARLGREMCERAAHLGADLDVRSSQTGTTVRLEVALSPP
jgi:signal transduction histidine kinase